MEKYKWWIAGIVIAIVAYVIWRKSTMVYPVATDSNEAVAVTLDENKKVVSVFPITLGSEGQEVRNIQAWLLRNEGAQIKVDGVWGRETNSAVGRLMGLKEITAEKYKSMGLK